MSKLTHGDPVATPQQCECHQLPVDTEEQLKYYALALLESGKGKAVVTMSQLGGGSWTGRKVRQSVGAVLSSRRADGAPSQARGGWRCPALTLVGLPSLSSCLTCAAQNLCLGAGGLACWRCGWCIYI